MSRTTVLFKILLILLSRCVWAAPLPKTLALEGGSLQQYELAFSAGDVAINPASVCNFQLLGKDRNILLLIAGQPEGDEASAKAHLRIWDQSDRFQHACVITVTRPGQSHHAKELEKALLTLDGLKDVSVTQVGSQLWAKGTAHTVDSLLKARSLCDCSEDVLCHIEPSPVLLEEAVVRINQRLRSSSLVGGVQAKRIEDRIVLEGRTTTESEKEAFLACARDVWPDAASRIALYVRPPIEKPTVYVRTKILEVSEEALDEIGIQWETPLHVSLGASASGGKGQETVSHHVFSASGSLSTDLLQLDRRRGDTRLLAEPAVAVQSGSEAKFVVGGEFPVLMAGEEGDRVEWKEYGLILSVQPDADPDSNEIALQLHLEWSILDWANAVHNRRTRVPAIVKKEVSDRLIVRNNDVVALAGLLKDISSRDIKGLQGLSSLPILGELFKSRQFKKGRSRLVMLVQPSLEESLSEPDESFLDYGEPGIHKKDDVPDSL